MPSPFEMKTIFHLLWLSLARFEMGLAEDSFLCEDVEVYCATQGSVLVTDPEDYCGDDVPYDYPSACNCGALCLKSLENEEECSATFTIGTSDSICGSGLICKRENESDFMSTKRCTPNTGKVCIQEMLDYASAVSDGSLGVGRMNPNCDEFGDYDRVQCSPGQTCYCSDKDGNRLFGEDVTSNFDDMTCDCARYWGGAKVFGLEIGMRCLPNGNFDSLQCFGDICYCYDEASHEITIGPMSISILRELECYDPDIHKVNYTNPCDEELASIQALSPETPNLIIIAGTSLPTCARDGYYASVQTRKSVTLCVDYLGKQIEEFEVPNYLKAGMNCHCARRRAVMTAADITTNLPVCCKNGNFRPVQTRGLYSYCVDVNGNQVGSQVLSQNSASLACSLTQCLEDSYGDLLT